MKDIPGLTDTENKIYLVLLRSGPSLASEVSKKAGLHRRTVYDVLDRLVEKGFAGYMMQNNKRYYEAASPEKMLNVMDEKRAELEKMLPELSKLYSSTKDKQETLFFRGKAGVKNIFEDQIKEGKEVLILADSNYAHDLLKYYLPQYEMKRKKHNIKLKIIYEEGAKHRKIPLCKIKYLPKDFHNPVSINIYGNKIAIIVWKSPMVILIKEKEVADSFRSYFNRLWEIARK